MNEIMKIFEQIDSMLFQMSVSGDDVFRMAQIRQGLCGLRDVINQELSHREEAGEKSDDCE